MFAERRSMLTEKAGLFDAAASPWPRPSLIIYELRSYIAAIAR